MRISRFISVVGIATLTGALFWGGSVAIATASTTSGGTIKIFSDQSNDTNGGATGPIVITGAIADYGTATSMDKNGTIDAQGNYVKVALKKGTLEINSVAFDKLANNAQPTDANSTICSGDISVSGSVSLFDGSGAYAGISGTLKVTAVFAFIGPKLKNSSCNNSNSAAPVAQFGTITGSGTVSF